MAQDKIMVVDNEMEIIQLMKLYLSREGYEVVWTTDSTKAVALAQDEDPWAERCPHSFRQLQESGDG